MEEDSDFRKSCWLPELDPKGHSDVDHSDVPGATITFMPLLHNKSVKFQKISSPLSIVDSARWRQDSELSEKVVGCHESLDAMTKGIQTVAAAIT